MSLTTNVGPESRAQTRSVATLTNLTFGEVDPRGVEPVSRLLLSLVSLDQDVYRLDAGKDSDDLGVDPRNRAELAGPVVAVVRPGEPRPLCGSHSAGIR